MSSIFDEKFIESIEEEDPLLSISKAIKICRDSLSGIETAWIEQDYDYLFETFCLCSAIIEGYHVDIPTIDITFSGHFDIDCQRISSYLEEIEPYLNERINKIKFESMKTKFMKQINQVFAYEFSNGDIDRIQKIINELREEIKKSDLFEDNHKERLLKRLEKLQSEMHKKMSSIDTFWGLIGDAGVVLGKFGKDSKPFVDRIKEISDIVWRTQARAEELPSDTPAPTLIETEIIEEEE